VLVAKLDKEVCANVLGYMTGKGTPVTKSCSLQTSNKVKEYLGD
jgi:hypothetical protein